MLIEGPKAVDMITGIFNEIPIYCHMSKAKQSMLNSEQLKEASQLFFYVHYSWIEGSYHAHA